MKKDHCSGLLSLGCLFPLVLSFKAKIIITNKDKKVKKQKIFCTDKNIKFSTKHDNVRAVATGFVGVVKPHPPLQPPLR